MFRPILRSIFLSVCMLLSTAMIARAQLEVFSLSEIRALEDPQLQQMITNYANSVSGGDPLSASEIDSITQSATSKMIGTEAEKAEFARKLKINLNDFNDLHSTMSRMGSGTTTETLVDVQMGVWKKGSEATLFSEEEIKETGDKVYKAVKRANDKNYQCKIFNSGCVNANSKKNTAMNEMRKANDVFQQQQQQLFCMEPILEAWAESMKNGGTGGDEKIYMPCGINKDLSYSEATDMANDLTATADEKKVSCKVTFNKDGEEGSISDGCGQKKDEAKKNAETDDSVDDNSIKITDRQPRAKRQANFDQCLDYKFEFNFWPPLVPSPLTSCYCGLVLDLVVDYNAPTAIVEVLREKGTTFLALDDDVMRGMIEDLGDIDRGSSLVGPIQGIFSAGTEGVTEFVPRKMLEVNVFGVAPLSRQELNASSREKGLVMACQIMSYLDSSGSDGFQAMGETIEAALGFYEDIEKIQETVESIKEIQQQIKMLTNINEWPIVKRLKGYRDLALAVKAMVEQGTVDPNVLCQASHALTEASSDVEQLGEMASSGTLNIPPSGTCTETSISAPNADGQRVGTIMRSKIEAYKDPKPITYGFGAEAPAPNLSSSVINTFKDEAMRNRPATLNQAILDERMGVLTARAEQDPAKPPYQYNNRVTDKREYFLMTRDEKELERWNSKGPDCDGKTKERRDGDWYCGDKKMPNPAYVPYFTSSGEMVFLCDKDRQYYNPVTGKLVRGQWERKTGAGLVGVNYRRCLAAQAAARSTCGDPFIYPKKPVTTAEVKKSGLVDPNAVSQPLPGMTQAETEELSRDIYDGTTNSPGAYDDPAVFAAADTNGDGRLSNEERSNYRTKEVTEVDELRKSVLGDDLADVAVVSSADELSSTTVAGRINELGGACVAGKPVGVWTGLVAIQGIQSGNKEQAIGALYALQPWAEEKINEYKKEREEAAAAKKAECEANKASAEESTMPDLRSDEEYVADLASGKETKKNTSCEAEAQKVKDEFNQKIAEVEEENAKANADEAAAAEGDSLKDKMTAQAEETKAFMEKQKADLQSTWNSCKNNYGIGEDQASDSNAGATCPAGFAMKCLNPETGDYDLPQSACGASDQKKMCYNSKTGKNDFSPEDAQMCRSVGKSIQAIQNRIDRYGDNISACKDAFADSKENREKAASWRMHGPDCGGRKGERRGDNWYCIDAAGNEERMDNPFESTSGGDNASNDSFCNSIGNGAGAVTSLFEGEDCSKIQDAERRKTCEEDQTVLQSMNQSLDECKNNYHGGTTGENAGSEKGGVCESMGEVMKGAREYIDAAEEKVKEYTDQAEAYVDELGNDISEALGLDSLCEGETNEEGKTESNNCGIDLGGLGDTMDDIKEAIATATDMVNQAGQFASRMDGMQRLLDGCNMQAKMQSMVANKAGIGFTMGYISSCDDRWHEGKPTLVQKLKNKLGDPSALCPVSFLVKEGFGENPLTAFFEGMGLCVGMWGSLEPRTGVTKDGNGFRGAALSAFRAFSIAKSMKTIRWNKYEWDSGGWDIKRDHIPGQETRGLKAASPMPQFNMDYPHQSTCYPTGTADIMWDSRLTGKELGGGGPNMEQYMNLTTDTLKAEAKKLIEKMFPAGGFDFSNIGNIKDATKAYEALETTFESARDVTSGPGAAIDAFVKKLFENVFQNILNNGMLGAIGVDQTDAHTFTFWGSEGCTTSFCPTMVVPFYCANSSAGPHFRWHGEFAEDF